MMTLGLRAEETEAMGAIGKNRRRREQAWSGIHICP